MKPTCLCFFLILFSICISGIGAQSNDVIDALMDMEDARYGETVYLAMSAAEYITERASVQMAMAALYQQGWNLKERDAEDTISLGEYSYILMKAFDLKGGIFYSMLPGPRYAAREMLFRGFIRGYGSPYRKLGGQEAVKILGKLMRSREVAE